MTDRRGVLFDVDGTLVDTNYQHVVAWLQAFRSQGHHVTARELHLAVGQGADRFVSSVLGQDDQKVADAHTDFYGEWLYQIDAFPSAADLLRATAGLGLAVVLASSASDKESEHLRRALDAEDVIEAMTNKADVERSKPSPDVVQAALSKAALEASECVYVGDTVWDVEAAARSGMPCVAVLSGGIAEASLRDAGAVAVYRDAADLLDSLDRSPIGELARR